MDIIIEASASFISLGLLMLLSCILYRVFRKKASFIKQVQHKQVYSIAVNNDGTIPRQIVGDNAYYMENHTYNHYIDQTSPGFACPNCHAETYRLYSNRGSRRIYECLNCHKTLTISYDGPSIIGIAMTGVILLEGASVIHDYLQRHHLLDHATDHVHDHLLDHATDHVHDHLLDHATDHILDSTIDILGDLFSWKKGEHIMGSIAGVSISLASLGLLILFIYVLYRIFRKKPFLTFDMLTDEEQDQYNTYVNQIDDALLLKFLITLPIKIALWATVSVITGGIGIPIFFAIRSLCKVRKNGRARYYITRLQEHYRCKEINWETFPSHSIVLGQKNKASNYSTGQFCPICKTYSLYRSFLNERREIWTCDNCHKNIVLNHSSAAKRLETIVIPGVTALTLTISAAAGEIISEHADSAIDIIGSLFEAIF